MSLTVSLSSLSLITGLGSSPSGLISLQGREQTAGGHHVDLAVNHLCRGCCATTRSVRREGRSGDGAGGPDLLTRSGVRWSPAMSAPSPQGRQRLPDGYLARFEVCGLQVGIYNERMRAVKVDRIGGSWWLASDAFGSSRAGLARRSTSLFCTGGCAHRVGRDGNDAVEAIERRALVRGCVSVQCPTLTSESLQPYPSRVVKGVVQAEQSARCFS
jgi:hypothetical protein